MQYTPGDRVVMHVGRAKRHAHGVVSSVIAQGQIIVVRDVITGRKRSTKQLELIERV